jgi:hypothetical protein
MVPTDILASPRARSAAIADWLASDATPQPLTPSSTSQATLRRTPAVVVDLDQIDEGTQSSADPPFRYRFAPRFGALSLEAASRHACHDEISLAHFFFGRRTSLHVLDRRIGIADLRPPMLQAPRRGCIICIAHRRANAVAPPVSRFRVEPILSVGLLYSAHRTMRRPSWTTHTGCGSSAQRTT